jgi:hypothetical protein
MRNLLLAVCSVIPLASCATGTAHRPSLTPSQPAVLPSATVEDGEEGSSSQLALGVGFTADPQATVIGATYEVPIDANLTVGPAIQFGFDEDVTIFAPYLKVKYELPGAMRNDDDVPTLLPFLVGGVGAVYIDKDGRSGDTGFLLNGGAGLRFLTGDKYRLGTEALVNWMPNRVAGERAYFSWEVLQIVFDF